MNGITEQRLCVALAEPRLHFIKTAAMISLLKRYFDQLIATNVHELPL